MSDITIDPSAFRRVLGAYPTGVCAITALGENGRPIGMIVGTFTSASLNPPLVGFLPDKRSSTWRQIEIAGRFCVNVLGSDQQTVCRRVAAKGDDKFGGHDFFISDHKLPVITGSIARIECTVHSLTDAGDHWFVLGNVLHIEISRDDDPLLFHKGRYGGFAEIAEPQFSV